MASNKGEKAKTESVGTEEQRGEFDLLTRILDEGRLARDEVQTARAKDIISEFVQEIMQGQMVVSKDTEAMISARPGARVRTRPAVSTVTAKVSVEDQVTIAPRTRLPRASNGTALSRTESISGNAWVLSPEITTRATCGRTMIVALA